MTPTRKTIVVAASTVLAPLTLGAGVASAHDVRIDTRLTAHFSNRQDAPSPRGIIFERTDYFSGRLISQKPRCEQDRRVRVFRKVPGDDIRMGADISDEEGRWRVEFEDPPNDTYYAKTGRKVLKNSPAHLHICKRARSQDMIVEGQKEPQ